MDEVDRAIANIRAKPVDYRANAIAYLRDRESTLLDTIEHYDDEAEEAAPKLADVQLRLSSLKRLWPAYFSAEELSADVEDEPGDPIQSLAYDPGRYPHCIELPAA